MSIEKQFSKGVAWMAVGNWVEQAVNLAVFVALARLLGAEEFGHVAMAVTFIILAEALVRETISEVLIADEDLTAERTNAVFWLLVGGSALLAVFMFAMSWPIALFYGEAIVGPLLRALAVSVVLVALAAVPVAILRRELKFRILSLRAIAGVVAGGLVGVTLAWFGFGVWSLVFHHLTLVTVNTIMAVTAVGWRPSRPTWQAGLGADFGSKMLGLRLGELFTTQTPIVVIGWALGPVATGQFAMAWRLVDIAAFLISTPIRYAAQPAFAALTRAGQDAARLFTEIGRLAAMIAVPAFAGLAMTGDMVVTLAFGEGWEEAGQILRVMCLVGFYFCIERLQQSFCLSTGTVGGLARISWIEAAVGLVLTLGAALFAGPVWGLAAVAVAMTVRSFVIWPLRFGLVARLGGPEPVRFIRQFAGPVVAALAMAAIVWAVRGALEGQLLAVQLFGAIAAGGGVFMVLAAVFFRDALGIVQRFLGEDVQETG